MKRISLAFFLLAATLSCAAQRMTPEQFVLEDPLRAANNLHFYEVTDSSVTKAPAGYKPFYISHIGRHGSRCHSSGSSFDIIGTIDKLDSLGLFSEEGQKAVALVRAVRDENLRLGIGALTPMGAREQKGIARRIAEHYPEVFSDQTRSNIRTYSTMVGRVLESREAFVAQINESCPGMNIILSGSGDGQRCYSEVCPAKFTSEEKKRHEAVSVSPYRDSVIASLDCRRLTEVFFTGGKVPEAIAGKEAKFFYDLYRAAASRQNLDLGDAPYIEPFFNQEELLVFWKAYNAYCYHKWAGSAENGCLRVRNCKPILDCMVEDADAVIDGADTCATFRFSHDTCILPLMFLLKMEGCDWVGSFRECSEHFCMTYAMTMAGNFQMVFFRNRSGKVLVKFVHNDHETVLSGLKPSRKGVFYEWNYLKQYFTTL